MYRINQTRVQMHLQEMIRLRTVSHQDGAQTDPVVFRQFRDLLKEQYPAVFAAGEHWEIGDYALLIRIPGKAEDAPSVLMAHYDVVAADESAWSVPPFGALLHDGRIWGRGALDTKCTVCAMLEAAEYLCRNGMVPEQDLYLSLGGEEEVSGAACGQIVSFLETRGVRPAFVLDEGGAVIPEGVPGYGRQTAMIGIAEKGVANYRLTLRDGSGGHASVPPRHTAAGRLAQAAVRVERYRFPARLSTAVKVMFRALADVVPAYERPLFRHPGLIWPTIAGAATALGSTFNAMVRTTTAITLMEGGTGYNVLPDRASIGINARLIEGDTVESVAARLRRAAGDPEMELTVISGTEPTPVSETDCDAYQRLCRVIRELWPGTPTAPYQMNGGTDARFYARITPYVYRFTPMVMSKEARVTVHGADESIAVSDLMKMVRFYVRLLETEIKSETPCRGSSADPVRQ